MKADVWWFVLGRRMVVEICGRVATNVFITHALACLKIFGLIKEDQRKRLLRRLEALELERCKC